MSGTVQSSSVQDKEAREIRSVAQLSSFCSGPNVIAVFEPFAEVANQSHKTFLDIFGRYVDCL